MQYYGDQRACGLVTHHHARRVSHLSSTKIKAPTLRNLLDLALCVSSSRSSSVSFILSLLYNKLVHVFP